MTYKGIYYGDAVIRLRNAGFTVSDVTYERKVRKAIDLRAVKAEIDVTFFRNDITGFFDATEIDNVIASKHKYSGMSFGGHTYP